MKGDFLRKEKHQCADYRAEALGRNVGVRMPCGERASESLKRTGPETDPPSL